jgi:hypothetical protein
MEHNDENFNELESLLELPRKELKRLFQLVNKNPHQIFEEGVFNDICSNMVNEHLNFGGGSIWYGGPTNCWFINFRMQMQEVVRLQRKHLVACGQTGNGLMWSERLAKRLCFYFQKPRMFEKIYLYSRYLWGIDPDFPGRGSRLVDLT